jgi:hypothetical protein
VEDAFFFVLLAPWEQWSTMPEVDWRGFRVSWVYTLDDDLFVRPSAPPSPDTLSWEPHIINISHDETIEIERPVCLRLDEAAIPALAAYDDAAWSVASVPLLTDDSQIGANVRVCADEENRADLDQRG